MSAGFEPGYVAPAANVGYFVKSRTTDGAWWLVSADGCTCPARTRSCWHIGRVLEKVRADEARNPLSVAKAHVNAMVD